MSIMFTYSQGSAVMLYIHAVIWRVSDLAEKYYSFKKDLKKLRVRKEKQAGQNFGIKT